MKKHAFPGLFTFQAFRLCDGYILLHVQYKIKNLFMDFFELAERFFSEPIADKRYYMVKTREEWSPEKEVAS